MKITLFCAILMATGGTQTVQSQTAEQAHRPLSFQSRRNSRIEMMRAMKQARTVSQRPPNNEYCVLNYAMPCYGPQDLRRAYGIAPLIDAGYGGRGQTIVIIVSFGSPTIEKDLKVFDRAFGLPDPPSLTVIAPLGTVPFDPTNADQWGWAIETSQDVEWAHAMAPEARIAVLTSPVSETQGVQGLPEFLKLEQYALDHRLGDIISQSWGTAENTLFDAAGEKLLWEFEQFYARAAAEGVTVLAGSGDFGSQGVDVEGNNYPFPTVNFPASSPYVLAVGGTSLYLDQQGEYQSETVWNDSAIGDGASGGGVSQYFAEPDYQRRLSLPWQGKLWGHRGLPDVSLNADPLTPAWIYLGFFPDPTYNDFYAAGSGVSIATPEWAGIIADANQIAGHPLGFLNPKIYAIGIRKEQSEFFHDITVGNNAYNALSGYQAIPGFDLASGWGTANLGKLLWELCH